MRRYGPLRLYWEGGYMGEGIFLKIKPIMTQGTHMPTFAETTLTRHYKDKAIDKLLDKERQMDEKQIGNSNIGSFFLTEQWNSCAVKWNCINRFQVLYMKGKSGLQ